MNISYGSLTVTLVSLSTHCQPENKQSKFQNECKNNVKEKKLAN